MAATAAVALAEAATAAVASAVVATAAAELVASVELGCQSAGYRCIAPDKSIGVSHAVGRVSDSFPLGSVSTVASMSSSKRSGRIFALRLKTLDLYGRRPCHERRNDCL